MNGTIRRRSEKIGNNLGKQKQNRAKRRLNTYTAMHDSDLQPHASFSVEAGKYIWYDDCEFDVYFTK